jgi:dihydrofolate reductase
MLGRNYFIHRSNERDLSCSCNSWIEDDTLEWEDQKVLVQRFVSTWQRAEGEAKFKETAKVFVVGGLKLVEDLFWEDLNDLGMLGFEEYHCVFSYIV